MIIERLNERFGTDWSKEDRLFVDAIFDDLAKDSTLQREAAANPIENFSLDFDTTFQNAIAGRLDRNEDIAAELLDREDLRQEVQAIYLPRLYRRARVARQRVCPIAELIGPDREDQYLEYKSTLRWDIKQESKKTGIPEAAVVKTIAGFLNSEYGGTLLIGVADDGAIHGLEDDYGTFSKRGERGDHDLVSQHLQNLVADRLGDAAATLVTWEFHRIDSHDLCRVSVEPSGFPVLEKKGDEEKFWWRLPSGTKEITDPQERERVISQRWS